MAVDLEHGVFVARGDAKIQEEPPPLWRNFFTTDRALFVLRFLHPPQIKPVHRVNLPSSNPV
ncbi:MAG: hypothetical protein ACPG6N_04795, partial [Flavobacteriales bacterium]